MDKKNGNRILIFFLLMMLVISSLQLSFIEPVKAASATITNAGSSYATSYGNQRKLVRGYDGTLYAVYLKNDSHLDVFFSKSVDGGVTWGSEVQISNHDSDAGIESPSMAVDSTQVLHIVYKVLIGSNYYLYYRKSNDSGITWSSAVDINPGVTYFCHAPVIAVNGYDVVYVVWNGRSVGGPASNQILLKTRASNGAWSGITALNADGTSQYPSIAIDRSNNVHVSWCGYYRGGSIYQIRYKNYTYATSTWSSITNVTAISVSGRHQLCSSIITNETGIVHIVWEGRTDASSNQYIRHVRYDGSSWSAIENISSASAHAYNPSASYDANGTLYVIYYQTLSSTRNIYMTTLLQGTTTWTAQTAIISDATEDRYPSMLWSEFPYIFGQRTNVPKTKYCFIWTADNTVKYFSSISLAWDGDTYMVILPESNTITIDWEVVHNASFHWDAVNDYVIDYNTTYIATTHYPQMYEYDIFNFQDVTSIPSMGSVTNVTLYAWMRKQNASTTTGDLMYFSGVYGHSKGAFALTTTWMLYSWKMTANPHTGLPWTWNDINSFTAGVCAYGLANCSQIYAYINYSSSYEIGEPTISFAADSTANGTYLFSDWINVNLTSTTGISTNESILFAGSQGNYGADAYRYDGTSWTTSLDTTGSDLVCNEFAEYNGKVYAAINGADAGDGDIYVFDPVTEAWSLSYNGTAAKGFFTLCEYNGLLYAGGIYAIMVFDGTTWTPGLTTGLYYTSSHEFDGDLYMGTYNPISVDDANIWKFDGATWTKVFDGGSFGTQYDWCFALEEYNGSLWAGMGSIGGYSGDVFNSTDGTTWTLSLDTPSGNSVWDLQSYNGSLFASMGLAAKGGDIWRYNGTAWIKTWDNTLYTRIMGLGVYDGKLWCGVYPYQKIFNSTDGITWVESTTFTNGEVNDFFAYNPSGYHYVAFDFENDIVEWERFEQFTPDDYSSYGNDGVITGDAQQSLGLGRYGKCYEFDGTGDYITIPTDSSLDSLDEAITISLWANSTTDYAVFPLTNRGLGGFYQSDTSRLYLCIGQNGRVYAYNKLSSSAVTMYLSPVLPTGFIRSWHHYVFSFTATNITLYIDGVYIGESTFGSYPNIGSLADGFQTEIARGSRNSGYDWYGCIDEYMIFNRTLNLIEIKALFNAEETQFKRNFTDLPNGVYNITGYAVNNMGYIDTTEIRVINISMQRPSIATLIHPIPNGTNTGILWETCQVLIENPNGVTTNVTWQENTTGVWVTRQTDIDVADGSTISWVYTQADELSHHYWFRVWLNTTYYNVSYVFNFIVGKTSCVIKGLTGNRLDWYGLPGGSYWCNSTGTYDETMEINITISEDDLISDVGIWAGDMNLVFFKNFSAGLNLNVKIPQWAIDACPNDSPRQIFSSIITPIFSITGYDENGTAVYWYKSDNDTSENTLKHILAMEDYQVYVNYSCDMTISTNVTVNASHVHVVFSSNNVTWGMNSRTFDNGGSIIVVNYAAWNMTNGCYGSNPFIPAFTNKTQSIYVRFLLDLPINMPSNNTYASLSADNWKVYLYSGSLLNVTEPPLNVPSLPSSGDMVEKWGISRATLGMQGEAQAVSCDINGDGVEEIFYNGQTYPSDNAKNKLVAVDGATGAILWTKITDPAYGSTNTMTHYPVMVYDFDKDGSYEVIISCGEHRTIMVNALTGVDEWNVSAGSGWHHQGYIDYGNKVILYIYGGGLLKKMYGTNGTVIKAVPHYYVCWGGPSIGDINGDGKYEIVLPDRNKGYDGVMTHRGLCVYDEDLNLLWNKDWLLCSPECPPLFDYNGDGILDIFVYSCSETSGTFYIFDGWGNILAQSASVFGTHTQCAVGDVDGDDHLETMDGRSTCPKILDLTTMAIEYTFSPSYLYNSYYPPDIANVILDSGETGAQKEIIVTAQSNAVVFKYNDGTYTKVYDFLHHAYASFTGDVDHDGYNEVVLTGADGIFCYDTKVLREYPEVTNNVQYGGFKRMNDGLYYEPPYYESSFLEVLSFGGICEIPAIAGITFVSSCISSNSVVEYNGFYGKGNYTTWLNATIYLPAGWTLDRFYIRIMNGTSLYENITAGFIQTTVNATHKRFSKLYNPSVMMNGVIDADVEVYLSLSFNDISIFDGNATFNDVFTIYRIGSPYNGSSKYNTTSTALDLTWMKGNYTDRSVVVRKTGVAYPTSPTDGTVVQNSTAQTFHDTGVLSSRAYAVFGYNSSTGSYSAPLDIPWGAIGVSVFNESKPIQAISFTLEISNKEGTQVYQHSGCTNIHYIDVQDIPYGNDVVFLVDANGYKQRLYYKDISLNTFYNYSFFLPPDTTTSTNGTTGDCSLRSFTNSINISTYTSDAVIYLSHEIEDVISVEIYNESLYDSYGGWLFIPESKYTISSTTVTINESAIDVNTTMARVTYYYMYCTGNIIQTPLYNLRVMETIETEYKIGDVGVDHAKIEIKRYMKTTGQYESVSILYTDANGYCGVFLLPETLYKVFITKDGYNDMLSDYWTTPPNQFGQTEEKIFNIEQINELGTTPSMPDGSVLPPTVVIMPYAFNVFQIYFLNLKNDSTSVEFNIYDGVILIFSEINTTSPNNVFVYFNITGLDIDNYVLRLVVIINKTDGSNETITKYFSLNQGGSFGDGMSAPIAAILSIAICFFGLTLASAKQVFGVIGIVTMLIAIAITAFADQVWYIHLVQAIDIILLIFVFLVFKEETVHAV